jgi:hypothetical protein
MIIKLAHFYLVIKGIVFKSQFKNFHHTWAVWYMEQVESVGHNWKRKDICCLQSVLCSPAAGVEIGTLCEQV